ncbi:hypothetical protein ACHAWT_005858 [Skeletonema menzelii]
MKRKIAEQTAAVTARSKKRSPLLGRPQNHYEAPEELKSTMTKEELAEWRKQMRKERNRASAAASRQKTQTRIMELEGEVSKWKKSYEDMQEKMMKLQQQVDLLTKVHCQDPAATAHHNGSGMSYVVSPTSSSYSHSSSSQEQIDALSLLQGLSRPQLVTSSDAALLLPPQSSSSEAQITVENTVMSNVDDSKKHLNTISRHAYLPAVKYTGANSLTNDKDILPELPKFDLPKGEVTATAQVSVADVDANATPDVKSVEMPSSSSSVSTESSNADSLTTAAATTSNESEKEGSIENDDDLLDLLVETLDVDFDHNLLP